jgi:hypothetical protein
MISYEGKSCVARLSCALLLYYLCTILLCKLQVNIYMNTNCSDALAIWFLSLWCCTAASSWCGFQFLNCLVLILICGSRIYNEIVWIVFKAHNILNSDACQRMALLRINF